MPSLFLGFKHRGIRAVYLASRAAIPGSPKKLLMIWATYADARGQTTIGQETLAAESWTSVRAVKRDARYLKSRKLITVRSRGWLASAAGPARRLTDRCTFNLDAIAALQRGEAAAETGDTSVPRVGGKDGGQVAQDGGQIAHETGDRSRKTGDPRVRVSDQGEPVLPPASAESTERDEPEAPLRTLRGGRAAVNPPETPSRNGHDRGLTRDELDRLEIAALKAAAAAAGENGAGHSPGYSAFVERLRKLDDAGHGDPRRVNAAWGEADADA